MSYTILDGKTTSSQIREEIKLEIESLTKTLPAPTISIILVGDDEASKVYTKNLQKACAYVGIKLLIYELPMDTSEDELVNLISTLNCSTEINGILVDLPLPKHINKNNVVSNISTLKDLDCFNPHNIGLLSIKKDGFKPCTPLGVLEILKQYNINLEGKNCAIIGRSNVIGKPLASLLLSENATVTVCHSYTKNLSDMTKHADILIAAVGKPKFVTADMVKENAIVIDVGIHVQEDGKLCGDVNFEEVKNKASYITPVPGGIGPMTTTMLLKNSLYAYKLQHNLPTN